MVTTGHVQPRYAALADGALTLGDVRMNSCEECGGGVAAVESRLRKYTMEPDKVLRQRAVLLLSVAVGMLNFAWFAVAYEKEHRWASEWKDMGGRKWLHPAVPALFCFRLCEVLFRARCLGKPAAISHREPRGSLPCRVGTRPSAPPPARTSRMVRKSSG